MRDLIEPGVPAFEGESFVGEMDLARSVQVEQLAPKGVHKALEDYLQSMLAVKCTDPLSAPASPCDLVGFLPLISWCAPHLPCLSCHRAHEYAVKSH